MEGFELMWEEGMAYEVNGCVGVMMVKAELVSYQRTLELSLVLVVRYFKNMQGIPRILHGSNVCQWVA